MSFPHKIYHSDQVGSIQCLRHGMPIPFHLDGTHDSVPSLTTLIRADGIGPRGWAEAVLEILNHYNETKEIA